MDDEDYDIPLSQLASNLRLDVNDEFIVDFDMELPIEDPSDDWELGLIDADNMEHASDISDITSASTAEDDDSNTCDDGQEMTHKDVLQMLLKMKNFAVVKDESMLDSLHGLIQRTERKIVQQKLNYVQSSLNSFVIRK